ncbi:MAG: glycerol-3-phosphate dehydrogenase/oxidase [Deltaproteobacteria bacterium]|jgi:glycerol-3-phosphate dehydrogenase|nr:glycerol-3-phosphate dehydrogenase/oxidase [Deltaproteobacteria bacterium]
MNISHIAQQWDLVIIGGGITGAGILREATNIGLQALLVEQKDFAWGTSSRSSKLVHGGLRYLKEGHFLLTKMAVEERELLLKQAPGLVEPLEFLLPVYEHQRPGKRTLKIGLSLYDLMAHERQHRFYDKTEFYRRMPYVRQHGLKGGFCFSDAQVDDSRLVLRLINESVAAGAAALNYTAAIDILRNDAGEVVGVNIADTETRQSRTLSTRTVINATGCWAEKLHPSPDPGRHLRPLRGSHLVFSAEVLPIKFGVSFVHPQDNRMIFVLPWEGAVLTGTTDLDHKTDLSQEPTITEDEIVYLMEGLNTLFPSIKISLKDCISAFAGLRPVLSEGKRLPQEESREHVVWVDKGLVTVTGGKLTTFRRLAWDALRAAKPFLPSGKYVDKHKPLFCKPPDGPLNRFGLADRVWRRLYGRYGQGADALAQAAEPQDLMHIPGTHTLWAELPFAAANEQVRHLDDLLLRRVRIGLLTPEGGKAHLKRIRNLCQPALPWDGKRWKEEIAMYTELWNRLHALPVQQAIKKRSKLLTPFMAAGKRLGTMTTKFLPKRWRSNPNG